MNHHLPDDPVTAADTKHDPSEWVSAYGDYLYRYAMSRLRSSTAAEEVVQETFLAGLRFESQYAGKGTQRGWLTGILKRKIVDFIRQRSRQARDAVSDHSEQTVDLFNEKGFWHKGAATWSNLPKGEMESAELWEIVRECLQHLSDNQADVFVLSVMEEIDSDAICEQLNITKTNLWVRLHRARLGLAGCVGAKWA